MKKLAIVLMTLGVVMSGCVVYDPPGHERGARHDRDHDGVRDRSDRDRDGDGVPNRADRRPDNPTRY